MAEDWVKISHHLGALHRLQLSPVLPHSLTCNPRPARAGGKCLSSESESAGVLTTDKKKTGFVHLKLERFILQHTHGRCEWMLE